MEPLGFVTQDGSGTQPLLRGCCCPGPSWTQGQQHTSGIAGPISGTWRGPEKGLWSPRHLPPSDTAPGKHRSTGLSRSAVGQQTTSVCVHRCLEMSEKPVQLPCERIFCPEFLQECLKPKKPLCALCCNALAPESSVGMGGRPRSQWRAGRLPAMASANISRSPWGT